MTVKRAARNRRRVQRSSHIDELDVARRAPRPQLCQKQQHVKDKETERQRGRHRETEGQAQRDRHKETRTRQNQQHVAAINQPRLAQVL